MKAEIQNKGLQILNYLYERGPLSNQELAMALTLSPSTISNTIKELDRLGLIQAFESNTYVRKIKSNERNKKTYHLNPDYGYAITVEIDYDFLNITKLKFDLSIEHSHKVAVRENMKDPIFKQIDEELEKLITECTNEKLLGVGFSLPGKVNSEEAISVYNTRMKDWRNVKFNYFAKHSNYLVLENIANCKAIGERIHRQNQSLYNFLFLNIGNGVGLGIFIDGKIYRGYNNAAGNAGHTILDEDSENICICGNKGCFESFVSHKAVCSQLSKLMKNEVESDIFSDPDFGIQEQIFKVLNKYYNEGNKVAFLIINDLAHKIGLACANYFQLFAPENIFIGGEICDLGEYFIGLIIQNVQKYYLPWNQQINIGYSQNNDEVGAVGLGLLVFRKSLEI